MRRMLMLMVAAAVLGGLLIANGGAVRGTLQDDEGTPEPTRGGARGLEILRSPYSVAETMDRLEAAMAENEDLMVVARVDHAANAASVDEELRPTELLIFGNPAVGTGLMQDTQTLGIDLPQKFLAWEDEDGQVHLAYNDPAYVTKRHRATVSDETIQNISDALANLADNAVAE